MIGKKSASTVGKVADEPKKEEDSEKSKSISDALKKPGLDQVKKPASRFGGTGL